MRSNAVANQSPAIPPPVCSPGAKYRIPGMRDSQAHDELEPRRLSRSGAVSWLSVANILLGGFVLFGGQCGVLLITAFGTEGGKLAGLGLPGIGGGTALSLMLVAAI